MVSRFSPLDFLSDRRTRIEEGLVQGQAHPTEGCVGGLIIIDPRSERGDPKEVRERTNSHPSVTETTPDLAKGLGVQGGKAPGGD